MTKVVIYTDVENNNIIRVVNGVTLQKAIEDVRDGVDYEVVSSNKLPDYLFRQAWEKVEDNVVVNLAIAKELCHTKRRNKRDEEMKSLDIEATIPAKANAAETARQAIRDKHEAIQTDIDNAVDEIVLKQLMVDNGLI